MKPTFSVTFPNGTIAPCEAEITDTYQAPDERISRIFTGDGTMLVWDYPDQTVIRHTYKRSGTFTLSAISVGNVASEPLYVTLYEQQPASWWTRFINWIKSLFGW